MRWAGVFRQLALLGVYISVAAVTAANGSALTAGHFRRARSCIPLWERRCDDSTCSRMRWVSDGYID
ncbi:hypothetical protein FIV38_21095 [Pseudomonas proteolytica]|nr:hypothetical protein F4W61_18575 [Pseudomonas proteolytica]TWR77690.1 hypothetical protein FIV38_21095 [Pseudomonas proteolytica]